MAPQDLSVAVDEDTRHVPIHPERRLAPAMRRAFVFGGAALLSGITINEMRLVLNVGGLTILEIVVLVLFAAEHDLDFVVRPDGDRRLRSTPVSAVRTAERGRSPAGRRS